MNALRRALHLDPSNVRARFLLARALQETGAEDLAIAELKQMLAMDPDHERGHYVLARLYQKKGDTEAARLEFEKHKNHQSTRSEHAISPPVDFDSRRRRILAPMRLSRSVVLALFCGAHDDGRRKT